MSVNTHASQTAKKYGRSYHEVRIAVNRIVNAGWDRTRAEQYVDEVLAVDTDGTKLAQAVEAVQREAEAAA